MKRISTRLTILALLVVAAAGMAAGPALAASVSGTVKTGKGYKVLVVQANGTTKKITITKTSGAFAVSGVQLNKATLQLVKRDGFYYGPVVLKAAGAKAYTLIRGTANLKIGIVTLKGGYALVGTPRTGRYQTSPSYTSKAAKGRPIGARKLGRVTTAEPAGFNGQGGDLDLDGVISAFDIDDNGNLILDNVDRSGRGSGRPLAGIAAVTGTRAARGDDPPPPPPQQPNEFRLFSNYKLTDATSINVNIPGLADVNGLIEAAVPTTVSLATQVMGDSAMLDGLGNSYIAQHTVNGVTYPIVNEGPPVYTGTLLNLTKVNQDAHITPGALPSEIGAGDSYVQIAADGTNYPGTLNFVFNTAPALMSYQFDTDANATEVIYDAHGVSPLGMTPNSASRLHVPAGATRMTLTFWRPQRQASAGEMGNTAGWIDIGALRYSVDTPNSPMSIDGVTGPASTHDARGAYVSASANGAAIVPSEDGALDSAGDAPASPENTITFTVDLSRTFSNWSILGARAEFDFDIMAMSGYGDNAARKLYFVLD